MKKNIFKKLVVGILTLTALSMTLLLSACGQKDVLIMYTESGFAPFEYMVGTEIVGVDVDIAKAIAEDLGKELVIKDVTFTTLLAGISEDNAFGAAAITIDDERKETLDFSVPYYLDSYQTLMVKKGTEVEVLENGNVSFETLKNMKLGVQAGTTGDKLLINKVKPATTHKQFDKVLIGLLDVKDDTLDGFVVDVTTATAITADDSSSYDVYRVENTNDEYGIAVKKGNTQLLNDINKTLEKLIADGTIDTFYKNHTSK